LAGIGRTNDAILYGASVTMLVKGDDAQLAELGPKVPASSSPMYGRPFIEIFKEVGYDFYKIDPLMFSPAQIVFNNIETGTVHTFGQINEQVLMKSFGMK
jgi:methenyltetrahydromethanopterin cyclohydrolase